MWIETLKIHNCRILKNIEIELSPHFNIITGDNGSGKTSLLEAISLLSRGRSFRTSRISEVISYTNSSVLITSTIHSKADTTTRIGIEKSINKTKIRINKKDIHSQSILSRYLPVTIIHPDSVKLITGSPSERRAFIDWLTFYLYPDFHEVWKSYQHILKQRNYCLKNAKHRYALNKWTEKLVELQPTIHEYRKKALDIVKPHFLNISSILLNGISCNIELKSGFPSDVSLNKKGLFNYYADKIDVDLKFGRTISGIHRADLNIVMNDFSALKTASRGQLKLLCITLLLAQTKAIQKKLSYKGIVIIDDIASELDHENKNKLIKYLATLDQQLIITTPSDVEIKFDNSKMFHVKHGQISPNYMDN